MSVEDDVTRKTWTAALAMAVACIGIASAASPARAALADFKGHLSIGYARLFIPEAPGGSFSMAGGLDYPLAHEFRFGIDFGYHLLGSRSFQRGSLYANVDYSELDAELMLHWQPSGGIGPLGRISAGPALVRARGDLSSSGTGAGFGDLAVSEYAPGMALDVTLIPVSEKLVRVGLEVGTRVGFLDSQTWTVAAVRGTFHF
jgi:hypothetical protein